jgi:hypothetical protein
MKLIVRLAMLALVSCAVEVVDAPPQPKETQQVQPVSDPNICQPGPWKACNGLLIGEFCPPRPFRCFPWLELPDQTYICSCSLQPEG